MKTSKQSDSNPLDLGTLPFNTTTRAAALLMDGAVSSTPMYDMAKWHQAHHAIE
ncbi:MAG TPA: hypothetical protein PLB25_16205 [Rhodoferax sp.]|nr:hypothetical protein [Rhodoferax sp.]